MRAPLLASSYDECGVHYFRLQLVFQLVLHIIIVPERPPQLGVRLGEHLQVPREPSELDIHVLAANFIVRLNLRAIDLHRYV